MGRNPKTKPVQILYIGRVEASYERVWQSLQQDGLAIAFARTQSQGMRMARELQPNVILINATNSHFSGARLCERLGRRLPHAKRLLITERGEDADIACEERLVRPFTGRKLRDTVRSLAETVVPHILRVGEVELDLVTRVVRAPLGRSHLTPKQCSLLAAFMQHPNQVISRQDLMREIWETHYLGDMRTLDVHIRWLREKIEADPAHPLLLVTIRGVGYKLCVPAPESSPVGSPKAGEHLSRS